MSVHSQKDCQHKILTIPNILSFFRLLLIPPIAWLYLTGQNVLWTLLLLLLSGLTDVVDGYVARRFNMVSNLGKALDPVADKLTQFVLLICLLARFPLMIVPIFVMFLKELAAGIMGLITIKRTGKVTSAVWHGKATTVLLYGTILVHLVWPGIPQVQSSILIGICTGVMLMSCTLYTMFYFHAIKGSSPKKYTL
ncbi:MAG: CDP-alcohol phosphatidyltransferase family protein [Oscillospiraceae bacterium]|nr:CDP-alcohol phosphatidyltransferase family protein [Oscillospiraceae bacterium]